MFSLSVESGLRLITLRPWAPSRTIHSSLTCGLRFVATFTSASHCLAVFSGGLSLRGSIMIIPLVDVSENVTKTAGSAGSAHCRQLPTCQLPGYLTVQPALLP